MPWYFPASDAVIAAKSSGKGKTRVQVLQTDRDFANRILVAGCDPAISVLARHVQAAGIELVLAHRRALAAIASRIASAARDYVASGKGACPSN